MSGFYIHVKEAIEINTLRRKKYSTLSNKKTLFLSNLLILSERFTLLLAKGFDKRAIPFNAKGIYVVKNDFVPMDIAPFDQKVERQNAMSSQVKNDISKAMKFYANSFKGKNWDQSKLLEVGSEGKKLYRRMEELENENSINFPMCKHMIESVVYIAMNGINYAKQSNNETLKITEDMIKIHKMALKLSTFVDGKANVFHQQNIGIILNDLPHIKI